MNQNNEPNDYDNYLFTNNENIENSNKKSFQKKFSIFNNEKEDDNDNIILEDGKVSKFLFNKLKLLINLLIFLLSMFLFILITKRYFMKIYDENQKIENILIIVNIIISFTICFIYIIYVIINYKYEKNKIYFEMDFSLNNILFLIFKILLLLVNSLPFLNHVNFDYYDINLSLYLNIKLNDILDILSYSKFFFLLTFILFNSKYSTDRSKRICNMYGVNNDIIFIFKCQINNFSLKFLFLLLMSAILFFGGILSIFEENSSNFNEFNYNQINMYWLTFITMSSVGYGDIYPITFLGKIISCISSIIGTILISFIVVGVYNKLNLNKFENKSLIWIKRILEKNKMLTLSKSVFKILFFLKNRLKNEKNKVTVFNSKIKTLKSYLNQLNYTRRNYKSISYDDIFDKILMMCKFHLSNLNNIFDKIKIRKEKNDINSLLSKSDQKTNNNNSKNGNNLESSELINNLIIMEEKTLNNLDNFDINKKIIANDKNMREDSFLDEGEENVEEDNLNTKLSN